MTISHKLKLEFKEYCRTRGGTSRVRLVYCCPTTTNSETITVSDRTGGITNSLLVITGAMGAGKSSVLGEASDILSLRQVAHAAIDLDGLGLVYLPSLPTDSAMCRNLRSVCENYMAIGVRRFLVSRAIENRSQLEVCRDAVSPTNMVVCRLTASLETMQQRVQAREKGVSQRDYIARVAKLNDTLDRAQLEDFVVANDNRSITDVAFEVLVKAGWIPN